jgi:uncharacterized protein
MEDSGPPARVPPRAVLPSLPVDRTSDLGPRTSDLGPRTSDLGLLTSPLLLLALAGFAGGFLGGLTGLGGGIVFAPVLLYTLGHAGVPENVRVPLVTGTSLFCILLSVTSGAWAQARRKAVEWRVAIFVGLVATVALYATKVLVTTRPWYTPRAFEVFFAGVLVLAALRMLFTGTDDPADEPRTDAARLGLTGLAAGALSAAGGVGGGIVLVPAYNRLVRLPLRTASGTSSATIVLSSLAGVVVFALTPAPGEPLPAATVGSVSFGLGLVLAVPAMLGAAFGVAAAHRLPVRTLRRVFALVVLALAARLAWG